MIDGVTILKQYDTSLSIESIIFFSILAGIIAFFFMLILPGPTLLPLSLVFGVIIGLTIFVNLKSENNIPNYYYDVIIDNSVSVNELYKDYEILKVDGKIYTIALREK